MKINLRLISPTLSNDSANFSRVVRALGEGLVLGNRLHLEAYPETPDLYDSGVRYIDESDRPEQGIDIPAIIQAGGSDCLNLSAWRIAELRQRENEKAKFRIFWKKYDDGFRLFHVLVRRGNGNLEDPSKLLGMGKI